MATVILELGRCGWGYAPRLIPELRLVVLRVGWCRGSLLLRVRDWGVALRTARDRA